MLPWWGWVLFWVVLLAGSAAYLGGGPGRCGGVPRRSAARCSARATLVAELEARADELRDVDPPPTAVTQPPHRMRAQYREQRASAKAARHVRRADRLPPWARVH